MSTEAINLSSIEDVLGFLEHENFHQRFAEAEAVELSLTGELEKLQIRIYGPDYHGELTGELARGIAVFQDEIYRATLNVLNSLGAEQGRLTAPQKELVALKIEVLDNCTLINFDMGELSKGLIGVLKSMPPKYIVAIVLAVAAMGATGWVASDLGGKYIDAQTAQAAQQAETRRHEIHAQNMDRLIGVLEHRATEAPELNAAKSFVDATKNGVREIAVRAVNATAVEVGARRLDEDDLKELRKRSPRTSPDKHDITEPHRIIRFAKGAPAKLVIAGRTFGEYPVDLDEYEFTREKIDALYEAFKKGEPINLSITLLVSGEKIKSALVVDIQP